MGPEERAEARAEQRNWQFQKIAHENRVDAELAERRSYRLQ